MFNYAELNYLISGTGVIDVRDWKNNTIVQKGKDQDGYISAFWDIVN